MALDKVKQGVIADDAIGSSQIAPDTVVAADIGANAITASELADNAVDTDAIASNAVTTAKITDANITTAKIADTNITAGKLHADITAGKVVITEVKPHIIPGVLQPAVSGKLLNGANHSGAYGTAQTQSGGDGHSYYYTDIKGSKPIKDPRIGGHFGSQRHLCDSIQLLEHETAAHGASEVPKANVYAVDGREWMRVVGSGITHSNNSSGNKIRFGTAAAFMEITGYFSDMNFSMFTEASRGLEYKLDGGTQTTSNFGTTVQGTPLSNRFVDAGSLINLGLSTTLGIHTIKLVIDDPVVLIYNIELIAHDSSNANEIKIPKQNVVSYGKKFEVGSDTLSNAVHPHYNPFNGFTNGNLAAVQALGIDTDTSLGLSKWLLSGTYYKPFNGGRVIKWVDSTGTIKTSVTMMPPNAKSIANSASPASAFATRTTASHYATNNAMNSFEAGTDLDSDKLSEVAKTFRFQEFGNGAANGGTGAPYADASLLASTTDPFAYVMDDGLTSLSNTDGHVQFSTSYSAGMYSENTGQRYITFIGTGISVNMRHTDTGNASDDHRVYIDGVEIKEWDGTSNDTTNHWVNYVQNLPYGTHILKIDRLAAVNSVVADNEYTFHQPKKPPIPEDACVLADYMLVADFVPVGANGGQYISKGVRGQALSKDIFADANVVFDAFQGTHISTKHPYGYRLVAGGNANSPTSTRVRLPSFATNFVARAYQFGTRHDLYIDTTIQSSNQTIENSPNSTAVYDTYAYLTNAQTNLGVYNFGFNAKNGAALNASALELATPIHTSHHYQPFETPFLQELIGGDRNMEHTNLVCSPDGKTWDEITRNKNYLTQDLVYLEGVSTTGGNYAAVSTRGAFHFQFSTKRGAAHGVVNTINRGHFALGYDRLICLIDGMYEIQGHYRIQSAGGQLATDIMVNGDRVGFLQTHNSAGNDCWAAAVAYLKRGDYVQVDNNTATSMQIYSGEVGEGFVKIYKV